MPTQATQTPDVETPETRPERTATPADPTTEEALELIRRDSLDDPRVFLDEVVVPGGGE